MFQKILFLVISSVVTIITTFITVRITMAGRVLNESTEAVLRTRVKKYWLLVYILAYEGLCIGALIYFVRSDAPLTRAEAFYISFWTTMAVGYAAMAIVLIIILWRGK